MRLESARSLIAQLKAERLSDHIEIASRLPAVAARVRAFSAVATARPRMPVALGIAATKTESESFICFTPFLPESDNTWRRLLLRSERISQTAGESTVEEPERSRTGAGEEPGRPHGGAPPPCLDPSRLSTFSVRPCGLPGTVPRSSYCLTP